MSERWWQKYQVELTPGINGPWELLDFAVDEDDPDVQMFNLRAMIHGHSGRRVEAGEYMRLNHKTRGVVMSDTPAEIANHLPILHLVERPHVRRVLINGLGLGMTLRWALRQPHIEHVDLVEIDERVIGLVGSQYDDPRLTIHCHDALTMTWPARTYWDAAWHDLWDAITADNLPDMHRLHRMYGRRASWQESWGRELIGYEARQTRY